MREGTTARHDGRLADCPIQPAATVFFGKPREARPNGWERRASHYYWLKHDLDARIG